MAPMHNVVLVGLACATVLRLIQDSKARKANALDKSADRVNASLGEKCPKSESRWKKAKGGIVHQGGWLLLMANVVNGVFGPAAAVGALMTCTLVVAWTSKIWTGDEKIVSKATSINGSSAETDFTGTWIKDFQASDSLEECFEEQQLNRVQRTLIRLGRGIDIKQTKESIRIEAFAAVKYLKTVEVFPFSGEVRKYRRRDLIRGCFDGHVKWFGPVLKLFLEWDDPHGGTGLDEFVLVNQNKLHVKTRIVKPSRTIVVTTVYYRKGSA